MKRFSLSSLALAPLLALVGASCSSSSPQPPTAYFTSSVGESNINGQNTGMCNIAQVGGTFFQVGTLSSPVQNGSSYEGAPISVTCQVTASSGAYAIQLQLSEGEQYSVEISGTLSDSPGVEQTGINVALTSNVSQYSSTPPDGMPCTATLTTQAPNNTPITAGRVWGTLNCPAVGDAEDNVMCSATATFFFENCQE